MEYCTTSNIHIWTSAIYMLLIFFSASKYNDILHDYFPLKLIGKYVLLYNKSDLLHIHHKYIYWSKKEFQTLLDLYEGILGTLWIASCCLNSLWRLISVITLSLDITVLIKLDSRVMSTCSYIYYTFFAQVTDTG